MFLLPQEITSNVLFAPIGLLNMLNGSGAVEDMNIHRNEKRCLVCVKVRGCGLFGSYCSQCPVKCLVDGSDTEFTYDADTGLLTFILPLPKEDMYKWAVEIQVDK